VQEYLEEDMNMMKMKSKEGFPKPFPYRIDFKLKTKLDILIEGLDKLDAWIIIDGREGAGKTNMAAYILYYVHCMTGREFTLDRFYFDAEELFEWVKINSDGLVNWDEAALGGLSSEWFTKSQLNLIKFSLVGRKKHHFFVLCIPSIFKLKDDLRERRSDCLIHMDFSKDKKHIGNYFYITRRGKKALNKLWRKNKSEPYVYCSRRYGGFHGSIPEVFKYILDENAYDLRKDEAIANIGVKKLSNSDQNYNLLKYRISQIKLPIKTKDELAKNLGIHRRNLYEWANLLLKTGKSPEKRESMVVKTDEYINNNQENHDDDKDVEDEMIDDGEKKDEA
jgi:hypothetical protein